MLEFEQDINIVFLNGKRVVLRPLLKIDIPRLLRWTNDPEVRKYVLRYLPVMEAHEDLWFEALSKDKENIVLMIVVDNVAIGTMGIHRINWKDGVATTGAIIGEKEYWGNGYGSEAKMILLNYAFNTLNLRKICSTVIAFNERSYHYNLKCGYLVEGRLKEHMYKDGAYWDEILMAVFKKDWLPLWEKFKETYSFTS